MEDARRKSLKKHHPRLNQMKIAMMNGFKVLADDLEDVAQRDLQVHAD